ncbi:MAG: hypothetical protein WBV82_09410 [Myxococcaceae bacterium]
MDALRSAAAPATTRPASIDDLFRSLGFSLQEDLEALAGWALAAVREGADEEVLLARARSRVETWFQHRLSTGFAAGRAAFVLCELAGRGAGVLTGERPLSIYELETLRAALLRATPAEVRCVMPEQQLELNPLAAFFRRVWQAATAP